jgi:hypothetical protein
MRRAYQKGGKVEGSIWHEQDVIPHGHPQRDENLARHMEDNYPTIPPVLYRGQKKVPKSDQFITQHGRATPSFASDPAVASVYSRTPSFFGPAQYEQSANVGAYHVSMKNPLDLSHHGEEITLGDLFDHLPINTNHEYGLKKGIVGYGDIADSIIDLDGIAAKVGAKTSVDDPNYGGYWVRNFKELADMIDEAGKHGDHEALHDALHGATLDTYLVGDHPGFVNMLHKLGYDGIIHKDVFDAGEKYYEGDKSKLEEGQGGGSVIDAYRPFMKRPQIKSATGNNGHFDPTNSDITKAAGGPVEPAIHPARLLSGVHIREEDYGQPIFTGSRHG